MTFILIVHKKNNLTINNSQVITLSVKTSVIYFFSGRGNKTFLESLNLPVFGSISINFTSISSPSLMPGFFYSLKTFPVNLRDME